MSGVDLSQSMTQTQEKKKKKIYDIGFVISILLLVGTLSLWGGIRFYIRSLDQKIVALDEKITANADDLEGEHINRLADFDTRATFLATYATASIDPRSFLEQIEKMMVSGVVLTGYEFDQEQQLATISGKTENFRKLAEQIVSLKSGGSFPKVEVMKVDRNKDGIIVFTIKAYTH